MKCSNCGSIDTDRKIATTKSGKVYPDKEIVGREFNLGRSRFVGSSVCEWICVYYKCKSCNELFYDEKLSKEKVYECSKCRGSVLTVKNKYIEFEDQFAILRLEGACPNCEKSVEGTLSNKTLPRKLLEKIF